MTGGEEPRIDRKNPTESLILQKPTLQVRHRGKKRMDAGSWEYHVFLKWIESGAANDEETSGVFRKLVVEPASLQFSEPGQQVQLKVIAHWDNGDIEDVTGLTRFQTNDESVAAVDENGLVNCVGSGDTHIVAFYDNGVTPVEVITPWDQRLADNYPTITAPTEIDRLVMAKLSRLGILPSEVCEDHEFLRRIRIDLTGSLPTPDEVLGFLDDPSPMKRQAKIEELLQSPEYAAWWTTKLCDFTGNNMLQMPDRNYRSEFSSQWWTWINHRIKANTPYNQLVAGIVTGSSRTSPDQSFEDFAREMSGYFSGKDAGRFEERDSMPHFWARRNVRTPEEKALSLSHAFLGVRIECAQCHKHPFDQWTKQDFDQFKAFFEPVKYGRNPYEPESDSKRGLTYGKVLRDIEEASGYDRKKSPNRRVLDEEIKKRVSAGEPVAWQEVFVDQRFLENRKKAQNAGNKQRQRLNTRVLTPKILGGEEVMLATWSDPREPLMEWMEDPDNPYFARAFVNRVWAHYFGRGLVEPADDLNLANPPVNEPVMAHLEKGFIASGFDMRWLHREILLSDTYQRSWKPNDSNRLDDKNFSHMILRRIPSEVFYDSLQQATAPDEDVEEFPSDIDDRTIGVQSSLLQPNRRNTPGYALGVFGKPERLNNCDCERNDSPTLLQTIFTRNDPEMLATIESSVRRNQRWIDEIREEFSQSTQSSDSIHRSHLQKARQAFLQLQQNKPTPPGNQTPAAMSAYRKEMRQFQSQLEKLKNQRDQLLNADPASYKSPSRQFPVEKYITQAFLRSLSRPPSDQEFVHAINDINKAENPVDGLKDLLWALLNTKEFLVNH